MNALAVRKAAVLLDRIADVYPTFDFKTQGILYESVRADGYVSVWHDATIETRAAGRRRHARSSTRQGTAPAARSASSQALDAGVISPRGSFLLPLPNRLEQDRRIAVAEESIGPGT